MKPVFLITIIILAAFACDPPVPNRTISSKQNESLKDSLLTQAVIRNDSSFYEKVFVRNGLVNIREMDSNIRVVLLYNTNANFIGKSFYGGLNQCYLPCEVATRLNNAQKLLKQNFPFYNLIVFDATRPLHIQKMMWDSLKMDPRLKFNYVARPQDISLHNYGAAVDVGIINEDGILLDMGTPFDYFGELAQPRYEQKYLESGQLSREAYDNRVLLRNIMQRSGFYYIITEWWHFNACNKSYAATNYKLIE